jgi:hypothetical protein
MTWVGLGLELEAGFFVEVVTSKLLGMDVITVSPEPFGWDGKITDDAGAGRIDGTGTDVGEASPRGNVIKMLMLFFGGEDLKEEGLKVGEVFLGVHHLVTFGDLFEEGGVDECKEAKTISRVDVIVFGGGDDLDLEGVVDGDFVGMENGGEAVEGVGGRGEEVVGHVFLNHAHDPV